MPGLSRIPVFGPHTLEGVPGVVSARRRGDVRGVVGPRGVLPYHYTVVAEKEQSQHHRGQRQHQTHGEGAMCRVCLPTQTTRPVRDGEANWLRALLLSREPL